MYAGVCADCHEAGDISRDGDGLGRCPECSRDEFAAVVGRLMHLCAYPLSNICVSAGDGPDNMHYNDADVTKRPN